MRSPVWHAGKRERLSLADGADFGATAIAVAVAAANGLLSRDQKYARNCS